MARVLTVDDSRPMRLMLRRMLEQAGHEVWEASDGVEALRLLRTCVVDVVLLDWNMPNANGLTTLRLLRARFGVSPKVVFITSEADVGRMREALAEGADRYVMKPFTAETLHMVLTDVVRVES